MDHLCGLGHRRIGLIAGPATSPASRDRLRGAMRRARAAGIAEQCVLLHGDWGIPSAIAAAEALLARSSPPTAVLCFNDEMAIGAIEVGRRRGLRIPLDLSVVGFDDIRIAQYLAPGLTTVALPLEEIGTHAVRVLLGILAGEVVRPPLIKLRHELKVRGTAAPPSRVDS